MTTQLKVNDRVYAIYRRKIEAVYTITRVTKTMAIGNSNIERFKRSVSSNGTITPLPTGLLSIYRYRLENDDLVEQKQLQDEKTRVISHMNSLQADIDSLDIEHLKALGTWLNIYRLEALKTPIKR